LANIGEITEVINATQVHLDLGSDRHILLQELEFHIGRPESRDAADIGSLYFYGQHDNWFEATLLLSTPEINTFVGYTVLDANGALPTNAFPLIYKNTSGATKTITVDAVLPDLTFSKPMEGGVKTRMKFRITEEITTADIT